MTARQGKTAKSEGDNFLWHRYLQPRQNEMRDNLYHAMRSVNTVCTETLQKFLAIFFTKVVVTVFLIKCTVKLFINLQ